MTAAREPSRHEHRVRVGRRPLVAFQRVQDTVRLETALHVLDLALAASPNLSDAHRQLVRQALTARLLRDARR